MFIAVLDGGCHGYKFCCLGGDGIILAEEGGSEVSETGSQGVCHASVTSVTVEKGGYKGGGELRGRERGGSQGRERGRKERRGGGGEVEGGMELGGKRDKVRKVKKEKIV